jgi:hypothetical protein
MGYNEPPAWTPYDSYCNQDEVKFIVSLMISGKDKNGKDFVPSYSDPENQRDSSDSASSSDSSSSSSSKKFTHPPPKFKVGDKVKYKRKAGDTKIHGTGTIAKLKCSRSVTCDESSSANPYRYEIGSLNEPVPGIWTRSCELCDEELIRLLGSNEKLEHEEEDKYKRHQRQQQESKLGKPLNKDSEELEVKPVEKPMKSTRKTSVPKIDQNSLKNHGDWSGFSSITSESSVGDVYERTRLEKDNDWSVRIGINESSDTMKSLPLCPPRPKVRVRLGIKLVFPGGERESQTYSVNKFLTVQAFKQRLGNDLVKTTHPISLFVSPYWRLLKHTGSVSDRSIPGTNTPCPFLEQGSIVRVEWGDRKVSLVGDTVISPKSPTRGGGREWNKVPEERLKSMKGISAEPVRWYSIDRPRASTQLIEREDTHNQPQQKTKRSESQQALIKAQVAERPTPLKLGKRQDEPERAQKKRDNQEWGTDPDDDPDPRRKGHVVTDTSPNSKHGDDDDVIMIVQITRNALDDAQQAFVDFQFTENRGYTGSFKMIATLDQLMNYYCDQWKTDSDTTSSDSDDEDRKKEDEDDSSTSEDEDSEIDEDEPDEKDTKGTPQGKIKEVNDLPFENSNNSIPKQNEEEKDPDPNERVAPNP